MTHTSYLVRREAGVKALHLPLGASQSPWGIPGTVWHVGRSRLQPYPAHLHIWMLLFSLPDPASRAGTLHLGDYAGVPFLWPHQWCRRAWLPLFSHPGELQLGPSRSLQPLPTPI